MRCRPFLHELLYRRIRAGEAVLLNQPVEHPLGGMPLLAVPALVLGEPPLDDVLEAGQHRDSGAGTRFGGCRGEVFLPAYLATEARLIPSRRTISLPGTPWKSSVPTLTCADMGTVICFPVPSGAYASQWQRRKELIGRSHVP